MDAYKVKAYQSLIAEVHQLLIGIQGRSVKDNEKLAEARDRLGENLPKKS